MKHSQIGDGALPFANGALLLTRIIENVPSVQIPPSGFPREDWGGVCHPGCFRKKSPQTIENKGRGYEKNLQESLRVRNRLNRRDL